MADSIHIPDTGKLALPRSCTGVHPSEKQPFAWPAPVRSAPRVCGTTETAWTEREALAERAQVFDENLVANLIAAGGKTMPGSASSPFASASAGTRGRGF